MSDRQGDVDRTELQLQTGGLTLIGVILSIGATVAFGVTAPWWLRLCLGVGTAAALFAVVGFGVRHTSVLRRITRWVTGQ